MELERWLSGHEHLLLLQRPQPAWWLTIMMLSLVLCRRWTHAKCIHIQACKGQT